MSQWNHQYYYRGQQGPSSNSGDNQYNNGSQGNSYVNFQRFISQIQDNSTQTNTNVYNAQYLTGVQNMPINSQNYENSLYRSVESNYAIPTLHYSNGYYRQNDLMNDLVANSNLTPTASEFIPNSTYPLENQENIHSCNDIQQNFNVSTNWRDRPSSSNHSQAFNDKKSSENPSSKYFSKYNQDTKPDLDNVSNKGGRFKNNPKNDNNFKTDESEIPRTFYNSSINKSSELSHNNKSEYSSRPRYWNGNRRVRDQENDKSYEQKFANSPFQKKEDKFNVMAEKRYSPVMKSKQNVIAGGHAEFTQRERLSDQLDKGTLECLVCCDRVRQTDPVWWCKNCYHVLHLRCIRKWAISSSVEGKWRCPACQNESSEIPTEYLCMCGAVRCPEWDRGAGAHTCGRMCGRPRTCPHPCALLCHPGPCPPCQATVLKQCGCGAETRSVLCSSKAQQACGRTCGKMRACGAHACTLPCHEGPCEPCTETVEQVCFCPAGKRRTVPCTAESNAGPWRCGGPCGRVLACGAHVCRTDCHPPPCDPCGLLPECVRTCPCGKMKIKDATRKSCMDPVPLCDNICARPLKCGPEGVAHFCQLKCHHGECPTCPEKTLVGCRCGHSSREILCAELPQMLGKVLCQKKCNKKLSCGRHRCRATCCPGGVVTHRCGVVCGRALACQRHRCEDFCHTGHCAPCTRLGFEEMTCECGAVVVPPPVACGARPPACTAPCARARPCGHAPHHACHADACPPCVVLVAGRCHGGHEERKTIPCSQVAEGFSCGMPCGKPLTCGAHSCVRTCHVGPCDTARCTQPCNEKRPTCGHPCSAPCHSSTDVKKTGEPSKLDGNGAEKCEGGEAKASEGSAKTRNGSKSSESVGKSEGGTKSSVSRAKSSVGGAKSSGGVVCPSATPCRHIVRATCACGRRQADRPCFENGRDYAKMTSALAALKLQEGDSIDLSEVQRLPSIIKTLECDDTCRVEARTRRMALALQIRNPDVSSKLAPRYSEHVRMMAARDPAFANHVHSKLTELVHLAKKSKQKTRSHSFPSMNRTKRQFVHELCEQFGCESVAYDAEPNRNVVATADKEKSWLPAMSIMEVLDREAGKRKVPGPMLRAATSSVTPSATTSTAGNACTGWATLKSTNAWASRQPKSQPPEAKIDYFDNPPDI